MAARLAFPDRKAPAYCPIVPEAGQDVAAELTAWLDSLPPHTTADLCGRTYTCETYIQLADKTDLTVRNGTLLRTVKGAIVHPKPNPHLWMVRATRCTVENLTVRGTNTVTDGWTGFGAYKRDYEFEAAIRWEGFTDCAVMGLDADAVWGDGVHWHGGDGAYMADSVIDRNGRQGVTCNGTNMLIERVRIEHSRRSGFDIEPPSAGHSVGNIEIRDCYTNSRLLPFASGGHGSVNNVWIHHNTSDGGAVPILYVRATDGANRANWRLEDHVTVRDLGSPAEAVRLTNVHGFTVARNTILLREGRSLMAVGATGCGGECTVADNDFGTSPDAYYFNRDPQSCQSLTITGNTPELTEVP